MQDLVKWSLKDENRAIQDALTQVGELFSVWTEVQRELTDHIKEFKHQVRRSPPNLRVVSFLFSLT